MAILFVSITYSATHKIKVKKYIIFFINKCLLKEAKVLSDRCNIVGPSVPCTGDSQCGIRRRNIFRCLTLSPPADRLASNSRALGTPDPSLPICFPSTKNNRIFKREGRGQLEIGHLKLIPLSSCFLTVHTVLIGGVGRDAHLDNQFNGPRRLGLNPSARLT